MCDVVSLDEVPSSAGRVSPKKYVRGGGSEMMESGWAGGRATLKRPLISATIFP